MTAIHHGPCDQGLIRAGSGGAAASLAPARKRLVLAATVLASSMAFIDGSVVNVALPAIQKSLAADAAAAQWVMNAYLLFLGALVLVGGAAADRFGRRRVLLIGVGVFTAASLGCALAPDVIILIAARAVQGIGAALLTPASLAILGASFSDAERGQATGAWAGFGAVTTAAGPVLGGWLVDHLSWRAVFFVNLPIAAAAIALVLFAVPESRDSEARGADIPGAALVAIGLGLVTWALTTAPARGFGWPPLTAALGLGALLLAAFVWFEARANTPMLPLQLFKSRDFSGTNLLTLFLYFALSGALFFLPFELIRVHRYSATAAGAALLPFSVVMSLFSPLAGRLGDRLGPRIPLIVGPLLAGAGLLLLALTADLQSYWTGVLPAMLVMSVGLTLSVAPLTSTVMGSVESVHAGKASGINNAVARVAGLLAVALMSLAFASSFDAALNSRLDRLSVAANARPARGQALALSLTDHDARIANAKRDAFQAAFRRAMLIAAGSAATAGGVAAAMIRPRIPRPRMPRPRMPRA